MQTSACQSAIIRNLFEVESKDLPLHRLMKRPQNKKGKGKKKTKKRKEYDICPVCSDNPQDYNEWVSCDNCKQWYHCICVGLTIEQTKESNFTCPNGCH